MTHHGRFEGDVGKHDDLWEGEEHVHARGPWSAHAVERLQRQHASERTNMEQQQQQSGTHHDGPSDPSQHRDTEGQRQHAGANDGCSRVVVRVVVAGRRGWGRARGAGGRWWGVGWGGQFGWGLAPPVARFGHVMPNARCRNPLASGRNCTGRPSPVMMCAVAPHHFALRWGSWCLMLALATG